MPPLYCRSGLGVIGSAVAIFLNRVPHIIIHGITISEVRPGGRWGGAYGGEDGVADVLAGEVVKII